MTRLSFTIPPSSVLSTGRAVDPRVFASSSGDRGLVMSTTLKSTSARSPLSSSNISSRCENGQTGMWWTVGLGSCCIASPRAQGALACLDPTSHAIRS